MSRSKEIIRTFFSVLAAIGGFFFFWKAIAFPAVVSGLIGIGLYFGIYFLTKPKVTIGHIDIGDLKGGEASLELMEEARRDIKSLERNIPRIRDGNVLKSVNGLASTGSMILEYLTDHPEKIQSAHRFADYYLDMSEKLVDKYIELQDTGFKGESAGRIAIDTKDALVKLNTAFDNQLNRLREGELMEIDTDIKVLNETLKMEEYL